MPTCLSWLPRSMTARKADGSPDSQKLRPIGSSIPLHISCVIALLSEESRAVAPGSSTPQRALILHGEGSDVSLTEMRGSLAALLSERPVYVRFIGIRSSRKNRTDVAFPCKARRA